MTTYEEWRTLLAPPLKRPDENGTSWADAVVDGAELWNRTYASVHAVVMVPMSWPGREGLDDSTIAGRERKRFGRWVLDATGLVCLGQSWDIGADDFEDLDWVQHVLGKRWCYDPTDFFDALQEARRAFCAHRGEDWIDNAVWEEVRAVVAGGDLPVFPSSMAKGERVYLANRMSQEERDVFAAFLAEQGIFAGD